MIKKIVLTGAGGRLGSYIREPISKICESLVSSDIKEDRAYYQGCYYCLSFRCYC